ncbi:hypothetical protein HYV83_05090 [Candidatus Woesearchaeota archaeon]|nr:hypothetical protein [Candidatus Woesearchaeota archaeon]
MLKRKKGLFDIEDFFSVLTYTLILFMFLVLLSLPKCSSGRTVQGLSSDANSVDRLNGEQLVLEMLRTPLPDNLPDVITSHSQKDTKITMKFTLYTGLAEAAPASFETEENFSIYKGQDWGGAVTLLNSKKELYKGATYADFIDNLQFMESNNDKRKNLFAVVTRAVFVRQLYPPHVIELHPELEKVLTYPEVYAKYGVAGKFGKKDADISNPLPEEKPVKVSIGGTTTVAEQSVGDAFAVIPVSDGSLSPRTATVLLKIAQVSGD